MAARRAQQRQAHGSAAVGCQHDAGDHGAEQRRRRQAIASSSSAARTTEPAISMLNARPEHPTGCRKRRVSAASCSGPSLTAWRSAVPGGPHRTFPRSAGCGRTRPSSSALGGVGVRRTGSWRRRRRAPPPSSSRSASTKSSSDDLVRGPSCRSSLRMGIHVERASGFGHDLWPGSAWIRPDRAAQNACLLRSMSPAGRSAPPAAIAYGRRVESTATAACTWS